MSIQNVPRALLLPSGQAPGGTGTHDPPGPGKQEPPASHGSSLPASHGKQSRSQDDEASWEVEGRSGVPRELP